MSFIDGENLTFRAQEVAKQDQWSVKLVQNEYYRQDCFVWLPDYRAQQGLASCTPPLEYHATRATYYTSLAADFPTLDEVRDNLRKLGFSPQVFKKSRKDQKAKGVDIALTKDMLSHAFLGNYRTAILMAGDGDYVPLVQEVQRLGKRVVVWFFDGDFTSPELKRVADEFSDISRAFMTAWGNYNSRNPGAQ
jgi:hypothetical protein